MQSIQYMIKSTMASTTESTNRFNQLAGINICFSRNPLGLKSIIRTEAWILTPYPELSLCSLQLSTKHKASSILLSVILYRVTSFWIASLPLYFTAKTIILLTGISYSER
ncbi:hypothetical protein O6H91_18G019200 [Diphasiastrum complanatum]|uniref:Uncharacterized protein n=1 Tax=Diphasiastrum complanatum TaxID=34168 RepID=A0ACC2AYK1_DIPCM|nr:hypothetical protein O6H91_18G019200 [Diphasiastrum complanatum]